MSDVGALDRGTLRDHLRRGHFILDCHPFRVQVQADEAAVADGLRSMYAGCNWQPRGFADFHIRLRRRRRLLPGRYRACLLEADGAQPFHPLPSNQAFAVLEWGLNWCIASHAEDWLILHAAVLARDDGRALVLPGAPGSGKSTLAAGLMLQGWRLLSDEFCMLRRQDGAAEALARPLSLKNRSIDIVRQRWSDGRFTTPIRDTVKGTVCHLRPTQKSVDHRAQPAAPAWIVFPRYDANAVNGTSRPPRAHSFVRLVEQAFNFHVLGEEGFQLLKAMVDHCDVRELVFHDLDAALTGIESIVGGVGEVSSVAGDSREVSAD